MTNRKSLIVYFRNPKALKQIGKRAEIMYYTKKSKYAIVYVSEEEQENLIKELKGIKLVRKVEESLNPNDEYQLDFDVQ